MHRQSFYIDKITNSIEDSVTDKSYDTETILFNGSVIF